MIAQVSDIPSSALAVRNGLGSSIPLATYRFQFHQHFTLRDAKTLVPYLASLGITHCYASPLLTARAGSMHGYDIVDHHQLNPEIGTDEDFEVFCQTLSEYRMQLIVDIVPNHMGVGSDNAWWMDVLEKGQMSEYATYFDINWNPIKPELKNKVLLPVLGGSYGQILENNELNVQFDATRGKFFLAYYEHVFPLNANSYPLILKPEPDPQGHGLLPPALQTVLTDCEHLLSVVVVTPVSKMPKNRVLYQNHSHAIQSALQVLCQESQAVKRWIQRQVARLNQPENVAQLHELLEAQAYRLASWRVASDEINYRRFFDVNGLSGLNMQDEKVFEDTHRLLLDWVATGKVTGFRIDHPDGLYDPAGYFNRLQEKAAELLPSNTDASETGTIGKPLYLLVEKILAPYESLPEQWPVHGTSGYEFGNRLTGLFVQPASEKQITAIYRNFQASPLPPQEQVYECKHLILKESLSSELNMLSSALYQLSEQDWKTRDFTLNNLRRALAEMITVFPVYRTYITAEDMTKKDKDYIQWAVQLAKKRNPLQDGSVFDFIHRLLTLDFSSGTPPEYRAGALNFAMKFQQLTGPVMAKGVEDTFFYRFNRLVSLNEVGGEPQHFGLALHSFHRQMQEQLKTFPHTMLNTATHDSKRSEDVRARINVLSEMPVLWEKYLERWSRLNKMKKTNIAHNPQTDELLDEADLAPSLNDEYLLYQTLLGMWPFLTEEPDTLKNRLTDYMIKACREAKTVTSWINPNETYEEGVTKFIEGLLSSEGTNAFLEDFLPFQNLVAFFGMLNSLSQTLVKCMVPGVPDIYQGNETWNFSMVDPDNRRPVDYALLTAMLNEIRKKSATSAMTQDDLSDSLRNYSDGRIKLLVTSQCLQYRLTRPDLFLYGEYIPLEVTGSAANHLVAFARRHNEKILVVAAPRFAYTLYQQALVNHVKEPSAGQNDDGFQINQFDARQAFPVGDNVWRDTRIILTPLGNLTRLKNIFTQTEIESENNLENHEEIISIQAAKLFETFPLAMCDVDVIE